MTTRSTAWSLGLLAGLALISLGCEPGKAGGAGGNGGGSSSVAMVGGDGVFNDTFIKVGGAASEGAYVITPYVNNTEQPAIAEFSAAFVAMHKREPDAWAALTYDAVGIYAKVISEVGPDRKKVRDALAAINTKEKGFRGVTGITYFNEDGDCVKPAIVSVVKSGKFAKADIQFSEAKSEAVWKLEGSGEAKGEPITLGVCGPFTGNSQQFGEMIRMGAELRIKEINDAGGIQGRPLQMKMGDDEGVNSKAANVANDLASDPAVVAVVGHFNSTCSLAARNIYKSNGVTMLSPGSTNVTVCKGNEWAFRNLYQDDFQGDLIARFLKEKLSKKKVVVFFDNDDYGKGLKDSFVKTAKEIGLEVVDPIPYNRESTTDFAPLVTKAKYESPDAIFVAGLYSEAALIAKKARETGLMR